MTEILSGGNSNHVIRDGDSVIRNTGPWSPFVHQLLQYLTATGFTESPLLLELTPGKERLSFIEGEVGNDPLKQYMQSDTILIAAAGLLRKFHDLTQHFVSSAENIPHVPVNSLPLEVICHNDFAPYNCVFKDNQLVGVIDFDSAAPGTRLWDIAYAVYRFAPLANDDHCAMLGWQPIPDRIARLNLFCEAYGLGDRSGLIDTVIRRLESLVSYMQKTASNLEHIPIYVNDLRFIADHKTEFTSALGCR